MGAQAGLHGAQEEPQGGAPQVGITFQEVALATYLAKLLRLLPRVEGSFLARQELSRAATSRAAKDGRRRCVPTGR
jgi:hypothetical protein